MLTAILQKTGTGRTLWAPGLVTVMMLALAMAFLCAALFGGCGPASGPGPKGPELQVTSFGPIEESGDGKTAAIRIRFNRPVVTEQQVGKPVAMVPASIAPPVRVSASWTDRQTLVLLPLSRLQASTRYTVALKAPDLAITGESRFSFVNRPLVVERVSGDDLRMAPSQPQIRLHFNQPVKATDVVRACGLVLQGSAEALPLESPDGDLVQAAVLLRPKTPLAQDQDFTVRCEKLAGHGGNAPMDKPYTVKGHTYPAFALLSMSPEGSAVPADEVQVELQFSTPVDPEELEKNLFMHPTTPMVKRGSFDSTGKRYMAVVDLKTTTDYTLRVAGTLKDQFGQTLGQDRRLTFTTSDAAPRLVMERGIYALETSAKGYPVWSRNVGRFTVDCARVEKKNVVRVLSSDMNYDPWYSTEENRAPEWKKMGLSPRHRPIAIAGAKNKWQLSELELPSLCADGKKPRGLYLAELQSQDVKAEDNYRYRPRQRVLANVTDLGVLFKVGPSSGLVWVTGISDGKPQKGARVTVYTLQGRQAFSGTTDEQGLLRIPGSTQLLRQPAPGDKNALESDEESGEDYDSWRVQRAIAIVEKGEDMAVVDGNWQNGIQIWNFGVQVDKTGGKTQVRGFIQSDRGIYRPGETVHFKGLVREVAVGLEPTVPRQRKMAVTVEDSRGAQVLKRSLQLSPFGGFSFDLPIAAEAPLGDYYVTATVQAQTFRERFQVEEFRKVTYELDLEGHKRHGLLGGKQAFKLTASYLFGAPVKEAEVRWQVARRSHMLNFPQLPGYTFNDYAAQGRYFWWWDYEGDNNPEFISEGEGMTDDDGRYSFEFRDEARSLEGPQDYLVQTTVTDETDQSVSKRIVFTGHPTDLYLGLHPQEFVQAVDMPFAANLVAVGLDGKRVAASATLSYVQERQICSYERTGYRSYPSCKSQHRKVWERAVTIPETGAAVERILPKEPGEFIIRLQGKDRRGRTVASSTYVWVIGKGEAFWSGDESARLSLVSARNEYEPGETARLVARGGLGGSTALVTLERGGILDAFVTSLPTSGSGLEIPIKDAHAPNVYASVALVRGRTGPGDEGRPQFKMGVVDLKVSSKRKRLTVEVLTESGEYQPGEQVKGTLRVLSDGQPVKAELSLSAADEGVLQLIAYKTPDPMKNFYAPYGLGIDSSTNWNRIARLNDPAVLDPDEGGDGPSLDDEQKVRSNFVSSAFWAPALLTDEKGEVGFAFKAPDNLTAFRLMAVAADAGSRFGSAESRITVKKPLLAKPVLPRFLTTGDSLELGVVVHNYTGAEGTALVTVKTQGLRLKASTRQVKLADGASARVRFPAEVGFVSSARVTFAVKMGDFSDALALTLPVGRPIVKERQTVAQGELDGDKELELVWPAGILEEDSRLEVSLDRTGLGELRSSLAYLIEYPYGCLEQTLSRFIPLTKVQDLAASLGLEELRGPRLRAFIKAGAAKVVRHQHDTGHFSLWPGSTTYPHLTTYALFGLNEAKRAGVDVDEQAIKRGLKAMRDWANASQRTLSPGGESATMAMAAYVLADLGQPDRGLNARLFEARAALPLYGQAFLLRALKLASDDPAKQKTLLDELLASVQVSGTEAVAKESYQGKISPDELHFYMSSDVRTSAIVLSALMQTAPDHPHVPLLAEGLKKARRGLDRWTNTQENLYALVALADFARDRGQGSSRVTLTLQGKPLGGGKLVGSQVLDIQQRLTRLPRGTLIISAKGRTRYAVRLLLARKTSQDDALERGFTVAREYRDPDGGSPLQTFKAGQLIKVRLTLTTPQDRHYVALVDPLPAGLEAVNTRLATSEETRSSPANEQRNWWERPVWAFTELRDDRVMAFSDRMKAGTHTLEYMARATIPGRFIAPPAQAEAMYEPDLTGRTPAARVEVQP